MSISCKIQVETHIIISNCHDNSKMEVIMTIHIVRLGSARASGEGLRIGTVRRPPRGVPKAEIAARDIYDVWLPELAPSEELLKMGRAVEDEKGWKQFERRYRAEMRQPDRKRLIDLLSALSHQTDLSVGCYCADEARCHRSILRTLLADADAVLADESRYPSA